jgi:hypothetical protein
MDHDAVLRCVALCCVVLCCVRACVQGSQEAGMIKSVGSVFENTIIADCSLGHLFNMCPFLEPAVRANDKLNDSSIHMYDKLNDRQACCLFTPVSSQEDETPLLFAKTGSGRKYT